MKKSSAPAAAQQIKQLSDIQWKTLIADDVRLEVGGKVSMLGLYLDDKLNVNLAPEALDPTQAAPVVIEGICILTTVSGLPRDTTFELQLLSPSGQAAAQGSVSLQAGPFANAILKFRPLTISELGQWKLILKSDGPGHEFAFDILRAPSLNVPPGPTTEAALKKRMKV